MMVWCFLHCRLGSVPGTLSVTPAPGRHDAVELISTHLLEPALALIVITSPGHVSQPHNLRLQFAVSCGITRLPHTRGRDYPDFTVFFTNVIVIPFRGLLDLPTTS